MSEMDLPKNFDFFERNTPNIMEKIIIEQGDDVCQNQIGTDYIKNVLKQYEFGFIRISPRASIGKRQTRQTPQHMYGFVLCKSIANPFLKTIDVTLVCSRKNSKDGKQLLELVEKRAKENGYQCLSLIAVGNTRLMKWYVSQGYFVETEKPIMDSEFTAYSMKKYI